MSGAVLAVSVGGYSLGADRLVIGLFTGLTYGLLAVGLVLVYRSSRFINFAHGSIGAFGAAILGLLVSQHGWPYWVAFPVALAVAAAVAAVTEAGLVRRLAGRPRLVGMIATLGLSQFVLVLALVLNSQGFSGFTFPQPPGLPTFHIGRTPVGPTYTAMLVLTPVLLLGLTWFLLRSRFGLAIRAAADDPDAARLEGVVSSRMATLSWAIAGAIAAFSAVLVTPTQGGETISTLGPSLLLKGLAGAVVARMESVRVAFGVSLAIGVVEQVLLSKSSDFGLVELVIGALILVALLAQPRLARRDDLRAMWPVVRRASVAVERDRRRVSVAAAVVGGTVAMALAWTVTNSVASTLTVVAGYALVGLSVVVVTGVAGQLSLGQFAVAGIGAAASLHVAAATHSFTLAVLASCAVGAAVAAAVGIPALRVRGLALAVTTLAFSLVTADWLLARPALLGTDGLTPGHLRIGGYSFVVAKDYYLVAVAMVAVAMVLVVNLQRSGLGRALYALRDNEDAARALGVPSRLRTVQAFALAGALAGLGGAVIAFGLALVSGSSFPADASISVVAVAVVGGLGSATGPLLGALYVVGLPALLKLDIVGQALVTLGWLVALLTLPRGLVGPFSGARDRLLARRSPERVETVTAVRGDEPVALSGRMPHAVVSRPARRAQGAPLLAVHEVAKSYGGTRAVAAVTLAVAEGEAVGIIGPNGAGKTTLFELIAGFVMPDAGRVRFAGRDVTTASPERRAQLGLVRSFQDARLFPTLTVLDTVMVAAERVAPASVVASLLGGRADEDKRRRRAEEYVDLLGITSLRDQPVAELSTGQRRLVELAAALTLEPTLLLLDEPSAGIAHREVSGLVDVFRRIHTDLGVTLVIIEHDLAVLAELADRLVAMDLGAVVADGDPDEVRRHPRVVSSYLGTEPELGSRSAALSTPGSAVGV